jgi:energy-coupling factor transporter ATP-binding protein EcfA2
VGLTMAKLDEQLTLYNVVELPGDRDEVGAVTALAGDWSWGSSTTPAVVAWLESIGRHNPADRHPWLLGEGTRLANAHRLGMITEDDHAAAVAALVGRFRWLLANRDPVRAESRGEVADALAFAVAKAEGMTQEQAVADWAYWEQRVGAGLHFDTSPGTAADPEDPYAAVRARFPRHDLAALVSPDRPPREWVVECLVPEGASVAVVGPAGSGKSLLLQAIMLAVARGDPTFADLAVASRRVCLIDRENTEDDHAERWAALGVTPENAADLDDLVLILLPPLSGLDTATGGLELAAVLDAYGIGRGDVVVLDSLQRVVDGPENDSDTLRAYYRHTAEPLKRRGVTVVRTDNTGKDAEKGARGTSGKRDDVDVELLVSLDAGHPGRMRIRPGKVRLGGVRPVILDREVDDDGRLTFTSRGDPFRVQVEDAHRLLRALDVPLDAGQRKAAEAIRESGHAVAREPLRTAIRERKLLFTASETAPDTDGAPPPGQHADARADTSRRTGGAPAQITGSERENRAEPLRRTDRARTDDAHGRGAPPLALSIERRTRGALDRESSAS